MLSFFRTCQSSLAAFWGARSGNVAITFGFALLPLAGVVGSAIDYSHQNSVKAAMQAALDSTALMISRDATTLSATDLNTRAGVYFNGLFNRPEASNIRISANYTASGGSSIIVNGSADVATTFMAALGVTKMTVSGSSTAKWGSTRLRVSLVLDTTGSMASAGKLAAMQSATKNLLSQLQSSATNNGDVYVSIVPFSRAVNVGSGNYNANWIDWSEWESEPAYMATWLANSTNLSTWEQTGPGDSCPVSSSKTGFTCTSGPSNSASNVNNVPSSGSYSGYICPGVDSGGKDGTKAGFYYNGCYNSTAATRTIASGSNASCGSTTNCSCSGNGSNRRCNQSYFTHTWIANARSTWGGCVADRGAVTAPGSNAGNDQTATAPTTSDRTTLYPARNDTYCGAATMGLNYNWSAMNSAVDGLDANGGTNQPIGLVMGWHSLVGIGPFTAPAKDANYTYSEVIILLSDGLNTWDRWYGNGSSTNASVDARMYGSSGQGTCANIKAAGVTIYTIQVNTDNDPTSTLLRNCASTTDKFYLLTSASQIISAFSAIGTNLTRLRVAQ